MRGTTISYLCKAYFLSSYFSHRLVFHQHALQAGNGEVCFLGLLVALLQILCQGHHGGDGVLRDGRRRVGGDSSNPDAGLLAQVDGDVVEASRAAQDQLVAILLQNVHLGGEDLLVDEDAHSREAVSLADDVVRGSIEALGDLSKIYFT